MPVELYTKGAPRSVINHSALCSYAAVLQCIAVSVSSAQIAKSCREVLDLTDDAVMGSTFKENATIHNALYEANITDVSFDDYVRKRAAAFLVCLHKLQAAEKTALKIPPILLQRPLESSSDTDPAVDLTSRGVKLSQARPERMRDAASLFCFFLFLDCAHILDRSSKVLFRSVERIQRMFRGVFFGRVSYTISLPSGCWLPVVKDSLKLNRKNINRPELFDRMFCSLFNTKFPILSTEIEKTGDSMSERHATDTNLFIQWPEVLVLHFDRCASSVSCGKLIKKKITSKIPLPFTFRPFRLSEDSSQNDHRSSQYFLQGIVVHEGVETGDGHFTCFVRRDTKWYYCSDTSYVVCSEDAVDSAEVYMAFYLKVSSSDSSRM
ncbi:ubiquitin specific protease-like protein [Perkinsela sp. CCAP 1560/4]|nr:ubiquitin specific protease-like protein [Perkinsela sp. CCAP 1560/4]|eukprot:KNH04891.1 ubiquitin specific protease-like protein [Perkinsela sp. CCAP 1560/4]